MATEEIACNPYAQRFGLAVSPLELSSYVTLLGRFRFRSLLQAYLALTLLRTHHLILGLATPPHKVAWMVATWQRSIATACRAGTIAMRELSTWTHRKQTMTLQLLRRTHLRNARTG